MSAPDTCPDCARPVERSTSAFYRALSSSQRTEYCANRGGPHCRDLTIARMRPVVAAAVAWFNAPDAGIEALAADLGLVDALDRGGFIPKLTAEELAVTGKPVST